MKRPLTPVSPLALAFRAGVSRWQFALAFRARSFRWLPTLGLTFLAVCAEFTAAPDNTERQVRAIRLDSLTFTIDDAQSASLVATVLDQAGVAFDDIPTGLTVDWSTSDATIITVDADGLLTAVHPGSARVTASVTSGVVAPVSVSADVTVRQVANDMSLVAGNTQQGTVGDELALNPRVRVVDRHGDGVPGVPMVFSVTAGGGSISSANALTDASGEAQTTWTLGTVSGPNALEVRFAPPRLQGLAVAFNATARPGAVTTLTKVSGDQQIAPMLARLPQPFVAKVSDRFGNGVPGVTVDWSITAGGGSLTVASSVSDADGLASTVLILGSSAGNTVVASIGGILTATYGATAVIPVATVEVTPSPASVASGSTIQLTATPKDANGNVLTGRVVTWSTSDANIAAVDASGLVSGTVAGSATITATVEGVSTPVTVTVTPGPLSLLTSTVSPASTAITSGGTTLLQFTARDAASNSLGGGLTVTFVVRSGTSGTSTGTLSPTTDHGNGTYSALFTGELAGGAATIDVVVGGQAHAVTPQITVMTGTASAATSVVTVSQPIVPVGATATLRLQTRDAAGNALTTGGLNVVFTTSGGTSDGSIGPTTDEGNGRYNAVYTAATPGTAVQVHASIDGSAVTTAVPSLTVIPASSGALLQWVLQAGAWSNTAAWDIGRVPHPADTARIANPGTYVVTLDQSTTLTKLVVGAAGGGATPTLDATGAAVSASDSVVVRAGGTLRLGGASTLSTATLHNAGTTILAGTEVFAAARNDADLVVQPALSGATISTLNGALDNRGQLRVQGATLNATATLTIAATGTLLGNGTVNVTPGQLQLLGTVSPGLVPQGAATLTLGTLTVGGSGARAIEIDIGGTDGGTQYDRLVVSSNADVTGGTLNVHLVNGFTPAAGHTFSVLTHASKTGAFATVNLPALPSDRRWEVAHGATELVLSVVLRTPTQVQFAVPPANATAGTLLSPAPQIEIRDATGTVVTTAQDLVTLTVADAAGTPTSQTYEAQAVNGVATFSNITFSTAADYRLIATSGSLTSAMSAVFTISPAAPATLELVDGDGQSGAAGQQLAQPLRVRVLDGFGNGVPNVSVAFAITAGTGSLGSPSATTSASAPIGVATTTWTLGAALGAQSVQASIGALPPVVFGATSTAGAASRLAFVVQPSNALVNTGIAPAMQVRIEDALGNPVSGTDAITLAIANNPGSATLGGTVTQAANNGVATFPGITVTQPGVGYTLTATATGLDPATSTAFNIANAPAISLDMGGNNVVGVLGQQPVAVQLNAPAPGGGVTVTVTSDAPGTVSVQPPGTTFIAAGETTGEVIIEGVALGSTTLRANAAGHQEGTLVVAATNQIISLPTTINVPYGQQTSLPVTLAVPAPVGGASISITTTDATRVGVVTSTVNFAAGEQLRNATLSGEFPGTATVRATATGWAPDASAASTTAALNVVETSTSLNPVFPSNITVEFRSGGIAVAVPSPGIPVTIGSANPACAVATSPITIPTGQVNVTATVTYGGTAPLPCSTTLTASSANLTSDNISVTVNVPPGINVSGPTTVGSGLQQSGFGSLGAAPPGGTVVHLSSPDPALFRLSSSATVAGDAGGTLDITLNPGVTSFSFYVQAMDGVTGTASITATAPNFNNGSASVTVVTPVYQLNNVSSTYTTLSPNALIYASIGIGSGAVSTGQAVRAGGTPLTVQFTSNAPAVAQLNSTTGGTATTLTATIAPTQSNSPTSVATGGIALTSYAAGSGSVTTSIAGFTSTPGATRSFTVSAPKINLASTSAIGSGLQQSSFFSLGATAPAGGVIVHLTSSDASRVLFSPNSTTPGTATLDVSVPQGSGSGTFYIQALAGQTGTVSLYAMATAFEGDTASATLETPRFQLNNVSSSYTTLSPVAMIYVSIGVGNTSNITAGQAVRAGGDSVFATISNSNATVARLDSGSTNAQSFVMAIAPGQSNTATSLAAGATGFHALAEGTTTVTSSIAGFNSTTAATRTTTVTAATINLNGFPSVGSGLQQGNSGSLFAAAPPGGVTVHLVSSDATKLILAPNATTVGTGTLDIVVAQGQNSFSYYAQALEAQTGDVTITGSAPGHTDRTITVTLVPPLVQLANLSTTYNTLAPNTAFYANIGAGSGTSTASIATSQNIRAGGTAVTATFTSSNPTFAQLAKTSESGGTLTATINPGQSLTPTTVAAGGVAIDPLSTGTTDISVTIPGFIGTPQATRTVTITTPAITLSAVGALGSGLQQFASGGLGQVAAAGGVTVRLVSSDSSRLLLAPNATTVGTGTLDIVVPQNQGSFTYITQAIEALTGTVTVTATASGYSQGSGNVSIVTPVLQINSLNSTYTASAANAPFFVSVGVGNSNNITSTQVVRAGATALTATITNSQASVAQLVKTGVTAQSVTVTIAAGQSNSPTTVALGGVAFDPLATGSTSVAATIPGFTQTLAAIRAITVNP